MLTSSRHDQAGRVARAVARLVAGSVAIVGLVVVDLAIVAPWRPALAITALVFGGLIGLCLYDGRRHARAIEEMRRLDALRRAATVPALDDEWGWPR